MFQILDTATLLRLLDASPEAVFHTIESGLWSGCIWPGNAEWELHEPCAQVRSLTIHYVSVNHPSADVPHIEAMAQVLSSQACPQGGAAHLDAEVLVHQSMLWLWAMAGGPTPEELPNRPESPLNGQNVPIPLPGGDAVAFTTTALTLLDALLFTGEAAAYQVAMTFLRQHRDSLSHRGIELIESLSREEASRTVEEDVVCSVCGAQELEFWYSGQTWGEVLCEPCYEARVTTGEARPQES